MTKEEFNRLEVGDVVQLISLPQWNHAESENYLTIGDYYSVYQKNTNYSVHLDIPIIHQVDKYHREKYFINPQRLRVTTIKNLPKDNQQSILGIISI